MTSVRIFTGSAESMRALNDSEVTLTVTSPPYYNAIDYDRYLDGSTEWKTRAYAKGFDTYHDYLGLMTRVFAETHRVTRPGGFCAIVVGSILHNKRMLPLPFDLADRMLSLGWIFHQDFVWRKTWSASKRAGVFIQHPYPGNYYPNIITELILVFRKSGTLDRPKSLRDPILIDTLFTREIAGDIWHIEPVRPGRIGHPCPFPEEIPHRLISLYTAREETVLDPFAGSGQTLKVARALNRRAVGYELEPDFAELARQRAAEPYERAKQVVSRFEPVEPGIPPKPKRGAA